MLEAIHIGGGGHRLQHNRIHITSGGLQANMNRSNIIGMAPPLVGWRTPISQAI